MELTRNLLVNSYFKKDPVVTNIQLLCIKSHFNKSSFLIRQGEREETTIEISGKLREAETVICKKIIGLNSLIYLKVMLVRKSPSK